MFCAKCGNSVAAGAAFCATCGTPTGAPGAAAPPPASPYQYAAPSAAYPPPAPSFAYATWADRAVGYIIDQVLVGGVMLLLFLVLGGFFGAMAGVAGDHSGFAGGMCCVLLIIFPVASLIVGIYNRVYLVSQRGYSIGQGVMKLKVIDANGQLLTQGNAAIRLLVQVGLGFVPFGGVLDLLWPLWDDRNQTLHDKAVGCFVIQNPDAR